MATKWRRERDVIYPDSELGFVSTPSQQTTSTWGGKVYWVSTDARGSRAPSTDSPLAETLDMIAIGSEETFGIGVGDDETFVARLGGQLDWSFGNFGIPDQNGVGAMLMMKRLRALKPKLVVYGFPAAHLERNVNICAGIGGPICREVPAVIVGGRPRIRLPRSPMLDAELVHEWRRDSEQMRAGGGLRLRLKWYLIGKLMSMKRTLYAKSPNDATTWSDMIKAGCFVLSRMDAIAAEIGATLVAVYIPSIMSRPIRGAADALVRSASDLRNTVFIDMAEAFNRELAQGRGLDVSGTGMMNQRAHQLIADAVVDMLSKHKLVAPIERGAA